MALTFSSTLLKAFCRSSAILLVFSFCSLSTTHSRSGFGKRSEQVMNTSLMIPKPCQQMHNNQCAFLFLNGIKQQMYCMHTTLQPPKKHRLWLQAFLWQNVSGPKAFQRDFGSWFLMATLGQPGVISLTPSTPTHHRPIYDINPCPMTLWILYPWISLSRFSFLFALLL